MNLKTNNKKKYYYIQHLTCRDWQGYWVKYVYEEEVLETALLAIFFETEEEAQKVADFNNNIRKYEQLKI